MKLIKLSVFAVLIFGLASCSQGGGGDQNTGKAESKEKEKNNEETQQASKEKAKKGVMEKNGIELTKVTSPRYPQSSLSLQSPKPGSKIDAGKTAFDFNVKNYNLKTQTPDVKKKNCANSKKGQHIHLILNNQPYTAHYKSSFQKQLDKGHYVVLAFLSRSYHESIKTSKAKVLTQVTVGDAKNKDVDLSKPHMFYSRPKGTYLGKDTSNLLLDFYVANANLSKDGHKVRATINGTSFTITDWKPYFINGLPMGENKIKLEFLNSEGNLVESPFNPVTRTVTLSADEPLDS